MPTSFVIPAISLPYTAEGEEAVLQAKKKLKRLGISSQNAVYRLYRRSVDARKKDDIRFVYSVAVTGDFSVLECKKIEGCGALPLVTQDPFSFPLGKTALPFRPIVVGSGPAGLFCALALAENGYRPLLLERGGDTEERAKAVAAFEKNRVLNLSSNVQFGAGGAGTFSDGKLLTRVNDALGNYILDRFVSFGAPEEILTLAKPHVGTDRLRAVVSRMLEKITSCGGEVRFHATLTDLSFSSGGQVSSVTLQNGETLPCSALFLAIGHSARDTYAMLLAKGLAIEPKPFSVGVRIEHLQEDIDRALFGAQAGDPRLGHAEYTLSDRTGARGVYTFCMCPGGQVVAAASEENGVVVNGMSNYARDGKNANAAVAVSVETEDFGNTPQGAIAYQRSVERAAFAAAGGDYAAPACLLGDFLAGKEGTAPTRIQPSYMGGGVSLVSPDRYLPKELTASLRRSLPVFGRRISGYDTADAVLTGPETRTSAPIRILRDKTSRTALGHGNLYPMGEGAGYAGGITSAALDGLYSAIAFMKEYQPAK